MSSSWPGTLKRGSTIANARDFPTRLTVSAVSRAADNATVGEDPFRAARIGIDYANHHECDKTILEALLLPDNQRVALHEVAVIEMNRIRARRPRPTTRSLP